MSDHRDPVREAIRRVVSASFSTRVGLDVAIGPLTTYRVGGIAAVLVELATGAEAAELAEIVAATGVPTLVIGHGSNLLVSDHGFAGVAVMLGPGFARIEVSGIRVITGGSAKLPVVARTTVDAGLSGFEWAVGVPGSVGGAIRMNAGGHGAEIRDSLVSVKVVDLGSGISRELAAESLRLGYRSSSITTSQLVLEAVFELERGRVDQGRRRMAEIVRWRRTNQPGGHNAGSVFANPPGHSAGRLIEEAGAKGLRVGSARVSTKHANFIQADDGGSADDIFELMCRVAGMVLETHGIELQAETRLVGFGHRRLGRG